MWLQQKRFSSTLLWLMQMTMVTISPKLKTQYKFFFYPNLSRECNHQLFCQWHRAAWSLGHPRFPPHSGRTTTNIVNIHWWFEVGDQWGFSDGAGVSNTHRRVRYQSFSRYVRADEPSSNQILIALDQSLSRASVTSEFLASAWEPMNPNLIGYVRIEMCQIETPFPQRRTK